MTAWQLIRVHLSTDPTVTSVAGGGIYPVRGKDFAKEKRPQIIGRQVANEPQKAIDDQTMMATSTLEIGCVALDYDGAVQLEEAVMSSLRTMRGKTILGKRILGVTIQDAIDADSPEDGAPFGRIISVQIIHKF